MTGVTAPGDPPRNRLRRGVMLLLVGLLVLAASATAGQGVALARSDGPTPVLAGHQTPATATGGAAVVARRARSRRSPLHAVRLASAAAARWRHPVGASPPAPGADLASPTRAGPDDGPRLDVPTGERFPPRAPPGPVRAP